MLCDFTFLHGADRKACCLVTVGGHRRTRPARHQCRDVGLDLRRPLQEVDAMRGPLHGPLQVQLAVGCDPAEERLVAQVFIITGELRGNVR